MAQPQVRRNTWEGPPSRTVVDTRATELLHVYIYDYCKKHNFNQAARSFATEANVSTEQQPPIDIATGFLADWWGVFWDVYHAKNKDAQATKEAGVHNEYHELMRNKKEEVLQQQRNFSMQQAVQQQHQQRRASEVQRMAQSPQLQQQPQRQQPQQQQQHQDPQQPPHVPSQQPQQQQQQQPGQARDHRPSPVNSIASLPNNNTNNMPLANNNNTTPTTASGNTTTTNAMTNTPQINPASLPSHQQQQQHAAAGRLGTSSPSFSPQQIHRPGGNESVAGGHPDGVMHSPMTNAQGIPMNAQQQMMMNQRQVMTPSNAIITNSMNALGLGGRDPQSLNPDERAAVQMHIRKQTMYMNQQAMVQNPNMMAVNNQAQARIQLQQQAMMNQQQSQPQPGQPPVPSQQGPQQNPQAVSNQASQNYPQNLGQVQQQGVPQPNQGGGGQPGQLAGANNPMGKNTMVQVGVPTSGGPGQMASNMQNPNMSAGQFGGGNGSEAMNMALAQQMMKNGQMSGLTPQQQQQQQQFLAQQQQQQRMLFNQRRMMQQQMQSGQSPANPNMSSPNPPAPVNAGSPQDAEKNRTSLALYQRRQMHYVMQQQHQDVQRQQQYVQQQQQQQQQQNQPQQQQQQQQQQPHPPKRQRPNPESENPNGPQAHNQSPQMGMASPHVMNASQTPQNPGNLPGSNEASPVMPMQQRLTSQQQPSPFNQDPTNTKPSQSPQMNRNMPNTPQQAPAIPSQQNVPSSTARLAWNPSAGGPDMTSPAMVEGNDQSPAAQMAAAAAQAAQTPMVGTPGGGGMMNNNGIGNMMSFDLERFMMSDGGDFGEIFTTGDDGSGGGEQSLLMGGGGGGNDEGNEMFGGGFLASMGGGGGFVGGDAGSALGGSGVGGNSGDPGHPPLQLFSELTGHTNKVVTVSFSLDGQWLASAGHDKKVLIWSVQEKRLRWTLEGYTAQITCARWSPDQRHWLVTSSFDRTLRVWDVGQAMKDGDGATEVKQIAKFDCHAPVTAVDFAPDRPDTICSLDAEGELNVWHISSSKSEKTIKIAVSKSHFAANPLRFHPRLGKRLACAAGNQLFVIDIDMAKNNASSADTSAIRTINAEHSKNICSLDWSSDGNYLVASSENAVIVYETGQWKRINMQTATNKISACAFVMPTGIGAGGDSGPGAAEKLRVVYGSYESIYVWQCSVPGSQPQSQPSGAKSAMVGGLACINTNGQTIVASASHAKEKNLMLWTL